MIKIDYEKLFFNAIDNGINFFTGAGFSVLPDSNGNALPLVNKLVDEVKKEFDKKLEEVKKEFNVSYGNDIEIISQTLSKQKDKEYQAFLRKRFKVASYNHLYDILDHINIKALITTNIDNIFQMVIANGNNHYIHNVAQYGEGGRKGESIEYIPLHGNCLDPDSRVYFGKFELGNVPQQNETLFKTAYVYAQRYPTLIVGYGMHDSGVVSYFSDLLQKQQRNFWIQCLSGTDEAQAYRDMGFCVIEGDTESLLKKIDEHIKSSTFVVSPLVSKIDKSWQKYSIPDLSGVKESVTQNDYYLRGETSWNHIITGKAYELEEVPEILDSVVTNKNIVITGIPLCGKTTILMQCARKLSNSSYGDVFYFENLMEEEAKFLCKNLKGKAVALVDDCASDMKAFSIFANDSRITTIGIANEYEYEAAKHILTDVECKHLAIGDICESEARSMYQFIPDLFLKPEFVYSKGEGDQYGMLEFYSDNVDGFLDDERVKRFIDNITDNEVVDLIFLTSYLNQNGSYLNTDVLLQYTGIGYSDVRELIDKTNKILAEVDENIHIDMNDQDYYQLRSHLFVNNVQKVAIKHYKSQYGDVVRKFIFEVSPGCIYHNYVFRRRAYDARFFKNLYGSNASEIYDQLYLNDGSAYTLQQRALYKSLCGRYQEAFSDIDDAAVLAPNNFSISNTRAVILFDAKLAVKWIDTLIKNGDSNSHKTRKLRKELDGYFASSQRLSL